MAPDRTTALEEIATKALTKREIDRRIENVIREVTSPVAGGGATVSGEDPSLPRRIEAADLVRRFRPFLVYN